VEAQTSKIHHHWQGPYDSTSDARSLIFEDIDLFQSQCRKKDNLKISGLCYMFRMTPTGKHVWLLAFWMMTMNGIWSWLNLQRIAYCMPSQMRATFVILLVFNEVGHPAGIFEKYWR
jgi:hypothetical protein